jgi:hypothetical protein
MKFRFDGELGVKQKCGSLPDEKWCINTINFYTIWAEIAMIFSASAPIGAGEPL